MASDYFAHETAIIDSPTEIGAGTRIWHFCHVMADARIGGNCILGQNVFVASGAIIGDRVKIQNNVSVYQGCILEDDVFLGPSCVLTNVVNPRAHIERKDAFETTTIRRGATIGANATVLCGVEVGRYAFIGAGAVVTRDVPDFALALGVPARIAGYVCRCGQPLERPESDPTARPHDVSCPSCDARYRIDSNGLSDLPSGD